MGWALMVAAILFQQAMEFERPLSELNGKRVFAKVKEPDFPWFIGDKRGKQPAERDSMFQLLWLRRLSFIKVVHQTMYISPFLDWEVRPCCLPQVAAQICYLLLIASLFISEGDEVNNSRNNDFSPSLILKHVTENVILCGTDEYPEATSRQNCEVGQVYSRLSWLLLLSGPFPFFPFPLLPSSPSSTSHNILPMSWIFFFFPGNEEMIQKPHSG